MLSELKQQFDIVTLASDWSKYEVLIFPDDILFDETTAEKVRSHILSGKAIISSGSSGLDMAEKEFVLKREWGVEYLGKNDFDPAYFSVSGSLKNGLPDMPLSLYSSGINMKPLEGTRTESLLIQPYYNKHWDGEYAFYYTPPDKITDIPALTIHGKVAHFSHRIFSGYAYQAPVELKTIFANVLNGFLPRPMVKCENIPSFGRIFLTAKPNRKMVHLLSYIPELRGRIQMIEEPITMTDIKLSLRLDGKPPRRVYLAPDKKSIPFKIVDGYVQVNIPVSKGYSLLVFEQ